MQALNIVESAPITAGVVDRLNLSLDDARKSIRESTDMLRKAYDHSQSNFTTTETIAFRQRLYSEAVLYGYRVYPHSVNLVKAVKTTFEYYEYLDYNQFVSKLPSLSEKCFEYSTIAYQARVKHSFVLENLLRLQDDMTITTNSLLESRARSTEVVEKIGERGALTAMVANTAIPVAAAAVTNVMTGGEIAVAVPMCLIALGLGALFYSLRLEKNAKEETRSVVIVSTNCTVLQSLLTSLGDLLSAVDVISGFMHNMANDLREIKSGNIDDERIEVHYTMMQGKSRDVVERCRQFIGTEDRITTALRSIRDTIEPDFERSWIARARQFELDNTVVSARTNGHIEEI